MIIGGRGRVCGRERCGRAAGRKRIWEVLRIRR